MRTTHTLSLSSVMTPLALSLLLAGAAGAQAPDVNAFNADIIIDAPASGGFGTRLAVIGDLNDDGFEDFLVAAPGFDSHRGRVWVVFGPLGTFDANYIFDGENAGDNFGFSMDSGGDFDGDGVPDFIIGAPLFDGAGTNRGRTYVISGDDGLPLATWTGATNGHEMGRLVRFFDNIDGMTGDEIIHLRRASTSNEEGEVRSIISAEPLFAFAGRFFSNAGVVDNQDSISDIATGFPFDDTNGTNAGRLFYVKGNNGSGIPSQFGPFGDPDEQMGGEIAFMGDVNGDGHGDVLVSGRPFDSDRGRARIISGFGAAFETLRLFEGEAQGDRFGISLANIGDVTGDGVPDAAVGADRNDEIWNEGGRVYIHSGASGALVRTFTAEDAGDHFGQSVAGADINGDGIPDVIVGAPDSTAPAGGLSGRIYIFFMPRPCPADLTGDGVVNGSDLAALLATWGDCPAPTEGPCLADFNGDGVVDGADEAFLLANWGACPDPEGGAESQSQAQSTGGGSGETFLLNLMGGYEFESVEAYFDWLDALSDEALSAHLIDLIQAILGGVE